MEIKRLEGAVEAILFAMGESVELGQIAKAIQQDKPTTEKLLHNLMDKYKDEGWESRSLSWKALISCAPNGITMAV